MPGFRAIAERALRQAGKGDLITDRGTVKVFHGTSERAAKSIDRSGELRNFPWFTTNRDVAERFARQTGNKPKVLSVEVDLDEVTPSLIDDEQVIFATPGKETLRRGDDGIFRTLAPVGAGSAAVLAGSDAEAGPLSGSPLASTGAASFLQRRQDRRKSLSDFVVGGGEAALELASSLAAPTLAGLATLSQAALGNPRPAQVRDRALSALSFEPRTQAGRELSQSALEGFANSGPGRALGAISEPLQPAFEQLDRGLERLPADLRAIVQSALDL